MNDKSLINRQGFCCIHKGFGEKVSESRRVFGTLGKGGLFSYLAARSCRGEKIMWTKEVFGTDVYHLVSAFIIYSIMGWLVESIYMSFCNHKLTNRGFARSPFCPIYGFGAVIGYLVLHPLEKDVFKLYLVGAVLATLFEFLVGMLMLRLFGEVWGVYND